MIKVEKVLEALVELNHYGEYGNFGLVLEEFVRQQQVEIETLKSQLEDCTCQGGHSQAYLKAKGRLK